jgi:hypothetical protein
MEQGGMQHLHPVAATAIKSIIAYVQKDAWACMNASAVVTRIEYVTGSRSCVPEGRE